jgi:ABC-type nitrate/sulfonate/bicarbonate transport system substrate-binding protein/signal transduction histidine kinase
MRKIFFIFILAAVTFASQALHPRTVTLQLKWNHQFQFAGYYAALEKGYYKDAGLDVKFRQLKEVKDSYAEVLEGRAEFGIYTSELLLRYHRGDPVVALGAIFQHSPLALMALKNSSITDIRALKDKKIMLEHGSAELEAYFKREAVKLLSQNTVAHTNNPQSLIDKQVDAMSVYITDEPFYLNKQKVEYRLFSPQNAGIDFYGDILFTTQKFAKNNPVLVEKFKKASMQGWEYALSHQAEIVELILKKYNSSSKTKEQLLFEAAQMQKLIKSDTVEIGYLYPWRLQHMIAVYEELGVTAHSGKQDVNDFIFENYIGKIKSEILSLSENEKAYLKNKKEITFCSDPDWMPLERIAKNGDHEGIAADMLKKLSEKIGVPLRLVSTKSWEESLLYAKERKCDILSLAMETQEREGYLTFTAPYFSSPLTLVTKNDKPFLGDPADGALGKHFAIVKDYATVDMLKKKYPNIKLVEVANIHDGLEKVKNGSVYGFIDALATISYAIGKDGWSDLKVSGKFDDNFELGAAVRSDDPVLFSIIEKGLQSISQKEKEAIFNRWFSVVVNEGISYGMVLKGLGAIAILMLLLYYKNVILKKQIEEETKKRLAQEQLLLEQSKMAQMGELLDMVAHQWKQPLTSIGLSIGEITMAYDYNELTKELLQESKETVNERISFLVKMVDDMRNFLNPNQKQSLFDVGSAAGEILLLLKGMFTGANITVETKLAENVMLFGTKNSFQNIILSVVTNSKDIFQLRNTPSPTIKITIKERPEDIILQITDNGGGIDADVIGKIFDYRFTTKESSGGTGVGLYLAKIIAREKLNGDISAYNVDNGVCFEVIFRK